MFMESLECFQTAIIIYEKVLMYGHIQFALGDYILSKLMIYIEQSINDQSDGLTQSNDQRENETDTNLDEDCTNQELYREILVSS